MPAGINYATGYVDLILRTDRYNAPLQKAYAALREVAGKTYTVNLKMVANSGLAKALAGLKQVKKDLAAPVTIPIRANPRPFFTAALQVERTLRSLQRRGTIDLKLNRGAATSSLNLYIQQLRATQAAARGVTLPRGPGAGGGGMGRGAFWSNTTFGGGFAQGAGGALGIPLGGSPQAMAGEMAGRALVGAAAGSVRTFADLESQLNDVRIVAGLSAGQLGEYKKSVMGLGASVPGVGIKDLIEIGQAGGRMGVADKGGVAGLTQFTRDLARVRLAIKDVGTEELANDIGRILGVFGYGTDAVAGFGSALVRMDNVSKASAADILDITKRLSGTAAAVGVTLPQVVALASVLKDVGLNNETAASSFDQIFRLMGSKSAKWAEAAGIDADRFADAYRKGPMEALSLIISKFKEMEDTIGGQEFLTKLGLRGVRVAGGLQQLSTQFENIRPRAEAAAAETGSQAALDRAQGIHATEVNASFTRAQNAVTGLADVVGGYLAPSAIGAANNLAAAASGDVSHLGRSATRFLLGDRAAAAIYGKGGVAEAAKAAGPAAMPAEKPGGDKAADDARARREAGEKGRALANSLIFQGLNRALGLVGTARDAKASLLGVAGRIGNDAAGALLSPASTASYSAGLAGGDVGRRIQEDILNARDAGGQEQQQKIAKNTADAAGTLSEVKAILQDRLGRAVEAVMGR